MVSILHYGNPYFSLLTVPLSGMDLHTLLIKIVNYNMKGQGCSIVLDTSIDLAV